MATPTPENRDSALHDFAGITIRNYIRNRCPTKLSPRLLDIGAGWGKYRLLLPEYRMDAVEIWQPYVEQNKLESLYHHVFVEDIRSFVKNPLRYQVAILGDTLEHLSAEDGVAVVNELLGKVGMIIAAVPYRMVQPPVDGNPYEEHQQPDLDEEVMRQRYPSLERLAFDGAKAVYVSH